MNRNTAKINAGIRRLASKPNEIISGTVVSGSIDTGENTITVQPAEGAPVAGVRLNAITGDNNGMILIPEEGSNVIIGSIDGPGECVLLRASEISKASVTIGDVNWVMDGDNITLQNSNVVLNLSESLLKLSTASESLFTLLRDLIKCITLITVPTPAGTSGAPLNVPDFNSLQTRLSNLLTS